MVLLLSGPRGILNFSLIVCGTHHSQVVAQAGHINGLKESVGSDNASLDKSSFDGLTQNLL